MCVTLTLMQNTESQTRQQDQSLKIALFAALGSGLEYYDFVIYGIMASYLSELFFPAIDSFSAQLQTCGIFAVGYFARPFGGTLVGMVADIYGRKKAFVFVMFMMAFATTAIGLLPTYAQVGILAPIGLLLLRVCQGLSFGAEMPGATTIVSECAPQSRWGMLSSMVLSSTTVGALCATGVLALLTRFFDNTAIFAGLWRVPFLVGGILAIFAYYIRRGLVETPEFITEKQKTQALSSSKIMLPLKILLNGHLSQLMMCFSLTFFLSTTVILNIYFPSYAHTYFGYDLKDVYFAMTMSLVCSCLFMLLAGLISDRMSKLKTLMYCLIFWAISLYPLFKLLHQNDFWSLQLFLIMYQLGIAVFFTNYLPLLPRLFPTHIRYTGVALGYNVGFSIASTMPIVASYILVPVNPSFRLTLLYSVPMILAFISVLCLRIQTRDKGYIYSVDHAPT